MSPSRIVFGKECQLPAKIEHKAYWAMKKCNMAYDQVRKERTLQLQEQEESRLEAYENSRIYKQKVKQFHDNQILRKKFKVSQKVLLFHSCLKLIADFVDRLRKPCCKSQLEISRLEETKPKPKNHENLNLRGWRSFGIVLGIGLE
ncbi:hypothetical protein CR513_48520, partial [Mucuna pruriens]